MSGATQRSSSHSTGGLALSAGVFALVDALIDANRYGSGSTRIVGLFAISAVCLGAFVALELRERVPMLDVCRRGSPLQRHGEVAERQFVSCATVQTQAISIYRKLAVTSRSEAVDRAVAVGLIDSAVVPPSRDFHLSG